MPVSTEHKAEPSVCRLERAGGRDRPLLLSDSAYHPHLSRSLSLSLSVSLSLIPNVGSGPSWIHAWPPPLAQVSYSTYTCTQARPRSSMPMTDNTKRLWTLYTLSDGHTMRHTHTHTHTHTHVGF